MFTNETPTAAGFCPVVRNPQFLCAFITPSPMYATGLVREMKRHNDTDEVFVLLEGSATLLTRDSLSEPCTVTPVLPHTAYNVHAGTWHYLAVSDSAKVFVTESGSLKRENTDTANVEAENIIAVIE